MLNYLPLVKLKDWLRRDGLDILVEQEKSDQDGTLKAMLRQAGLSDALATAISLERIEATHFSAEQSNKGQRKLNEKFSEYVAEVRDFEGIEYKGDSDALFSWFSRNRKKKIEEIVRRLSRHGVLGHYLLERIVDGDPESTGYVCLLREVVTLPRNVAEKIGKGLDKPTYESLCGTGLTDQGLMIGADDMAVPVIEIGSPTIEHILQSFSNLFGRIGVADPVDKVIGKIIDGCIAD
ncbi:hypothetical protein KZZ08_17670 [Roseovarius mucosus]|uniref:hypothetical protein n=1 Tax=Roseovarius mucosus TaxID=215743 RepID=UPI001C5ECFBF|nr:hypothetical protein [Roseovarius mucosus]MBW4975464.1 hypothetical protein [Roseovarius mucosus]